MRFTVTKGTAKGLACIRTFSSYAGVKEYVLEEMRSHKDLELGDYIEVSDRGGPHTFIFARVKDFELGWGACRRNFETQE